jgi:mono/diheme cytochrome c family protein
MRNLLHFPKLYAQPTSRAYRKVVSWGLLLAIGLLVAGCSDMITQSKYEPLAPSPLWPDGRSARPIPTGAVPVGYAAAGNPELSGSGSDGKPVDKNPLPVTVDLMKHGQEQFNIYCSPCHGFEGKGDGVAVQHGMPAPPNINTQAIYDLPDGTLFNVITNGFGRMFPYAYRIQPEDRWAIVAYVRALELSQNANPQLLSPDERQKLESQP